MPPSTRSFTQPTERVNLSRLLWVGPLVVIAAVTANALIATIARAILRTPPEFAPFTFPQYTFLTGMNQENQHGKTQT
ncbi:MAG: hypothetical protein ACRDH2_08525 [Anaerolineales bacterium]